MIIGNITKKIVGKIYLTAFIKTHTIKTFSLDLIIVFRFFFAIIYPSFKTLVLKYNGINQ